MYRARSLIYQNDPQKCYSIQQSKRLGYRAHAVIELAMPVMLQVKIGCIPVIRIYVSRYPPPPGHHSEKILV